MRLITLADSIIISIPLYLFILMSSQGEKVKVLICVTLLTIIGYLIPLLPQIFLLKDSTNLEPSLSQKGLWLYCSWSHSS